MRKTQKKKMKDFSLELNEVVKKLTDEEDEISKAVDVVKEDIKKNLKLI